MMALLCVDFTVSLAGKSLLNLSYTNLFSPNNYNSDKIIYKYCKDEYVKSQVQIKKIDETRIYLLQEIKHNDLINEKHKETYYTGILGTILGTCLFET